MGVQLGGPRQVSPGVWRGGDRFVNWWLVAEGGRVTLVDGGLPGHGEQLLPLLAAARVTPDALAAVVLTHGHSDHLGIVDRVRATTGATVLLHPADRRLAGAKGKLPAAAALQMWRPRAAAALVSYIRQGASRTTPVVDAAALGDDAPLDVPGRPRVIPTPGHTGGSCTLLLEDRGVALVGDALVTLDPYTGRTGPRLLPAWDNEDHDLALRSLEVLAGLSATVVLPGHGEPWRGPIADAARMARLRGGAGLLR